MESSGILIKRLCCHITGINDERIFQYYQLSVTLLNQDVLVSLTSGDFEIICNKIKRWLVRENLHKNAARFSFLLQKLQRSNILKNKTAILYLFWCLRNSQSFLPEAGTVLVNGNDFFHTPALHSSTLRISSDDLPTESDRESDAPNHSAGRVARLAAMYKDGMKLSVSGSPSSKPNKPTKLELKPKGRKESQIEILESDLLREILFAFQGIEGKVIKMDVTKGTLRIDPKVRLSFGQKDLVMKLIEVGWLYIKINRFCETNSKLCSSGKGPSHSKLGSGLVNQSLVLAFREQLNEYCRLISVLESQVQGTSGNDSPLSEGRSGLTLRRLLLWTLEPRSRLRTLALVAHAAKDTKGGATTSAIYQHLHHGDLSHVDVVRHALSQASKPLFVMLTEWLVDGNLQDPHEEFFISANPTVPNERLWHDKYTIRWSMLPSFISRLQAQKILSTGKSLNFLRNVCNFKSPINGRDSIKSALKKTTVESLFTQDESNQLQELISVTFSATSLHVLEEILTRHKLVDHLRALKKYLLLEQVDFIHYLMEIIEPELCQPANKLHPHALSSLLENAISASNAQFEDPDTLNRLDVRQLECSPGETGWDVFSLDYHVDGPIGTVFTSDCMRQYLMLFNALWRSKRMEWILSATWKAQAATSKKCRDLPELTGSLHWIQLLLTEMIHLVRQMAYYMTFEVLECSWHAMMTQLRSAQSLDDVIEAHQQFLKRVIAGALLDEDSRDVRAHLRSLYELMVRLKALQERLYNAVVVEVSAREHFQECIKVSSEIGDFGTNEELEAEEDLRRNEFSTKVFPAIKTDLRILSQSYQDMVQSFLLKLAQHEDENLHFLSSRLDFNEYYHRKDCRLNVRLTYLHKRKSMGASFNEKTL